MKLTEDEILRYSRHIILPEVGGRGQKKIRGARVLVLDPAGPGAACSLYLAAAGVGTIGLVSEDACRPGQDRTDQMDLLRPIGTGIIGAADQGIQPQGAVSNSLNPEAAVLKSLNPGVNVSAHSIDQFTSALAEYDMVISWVTGLGRWLELNRLCLGAGLPLVGAMIRSWTGALATAVPGGPCLGCVDWSGGGPLSELSRPEPLPEISASGEGVLAETLGVLQATEAIKLILGIGRSLAGRILIYSGLDQSFREFSFERSKTCPVCGTAPTVPSGAD